MMTQDENTRVEVIGDLCNKAHKMAQKFYGLISENQGNYFYARDLRISRPIEGNPDDFIVQLGGLDAYARYRNIARHEADRIAVSGRYDIFLIERIPFKGERLASECIGCIEIKTAGECVIDNVTYSLIPDPLAFDFRENFQMMFSCRIATVLQNSLFA